MIDIKKAVSGIPNIGLDILRSLFPASKELVGLDIGSHSVKLVEIVETPKKGYILNRFSMIPLLKGVVVDGVPVEEQELAMKIKDLFKQAKCKHKGIVTSLSGHSVIVKKVSFPTMEENELRDLIKDEVGKYLPFENTEEVSFDFQILGENEYNPSQMDVILVAAKNDIVTGYTDAIKAAGFKAIIMDVDSFALETMYEENYEFEENELAVLINIGASMTNINVVKGGVSVFTRDFTLAGNSITEAVQQKLGVDFEEAERVKIEGVKGGESEQQAFNSDLLAYADPICTEIERSVDYFRSTYGGEYIKHVILSGGTSLIPGIADDLSRRLDIEAELVDPFRKISIAKKAIDNGSSESVGPIAAVAIGLALRKLGDR
jgi:type IV pilus assembly protein PilM